MTDEDFINLEHSVGRHEGDLDQMSKQIQELKGDLKLVIKFCKPNAVAQARIRAMGILQSPYANTPPGDPVFQEKCRKFAAKYSSEVAPDF